MARTTGNTATMASRLLARGLDDRPAISAPELLGRRDECVELMLQGFGARSLTIEEIVEG
jgi:hypothetical protein